MGRRRKGKTQVARVPVELLRKARKFQEDCRKYGKQITVQDALRRMIR